jgi:hypothetical protein
LSELLRFAINTSRRTEKTPYRAFWSDLIFSGILKYSITWEIKGIKHLVKLNFEFSIPKYK